MTAYQNTLALGLVLALCSNAVLLVLLLLQLRSGVGTCGAGCSGTVAPISAATGRVDNNVDVSINSGVLDFGRSQILDYKQEVQSQVFGSNSLDTYSRSSEIDKRNMASTSSVNNPPETYTVLREILKTMQSNLPEISQSRSKSSLMFEMKKAINSQKRNNSSIPMSHVRNKRHSAYKAAYNKLLSDPGDHLFGQVFPKFNRKEMKKFANPVSHLLIPALTQFEKIVLKRLGRLNDRIVAHDLNIETIQMQVMEMREEFKRERRLANATRMLVAENLLPVRNNEELDEGSGEVDVVTSTTTTTTTTTTPRPTPQPRPTRPAEEYTAMFHLMQQLEQKVLSLENYNLMADSELTRTRDEVIKMDDKVTEFKRRQINLKTQGKRNLFRIRELETFKNQAQLSLHQALHDTARMDNRLDAFKDRLGQYSSELHIVSTEFERQAQVSEELRSADQYKAHDINEIRGEIRGMTQRLNDLYLALDTNVDTVRNDVRGVIDRMCTNNRLTC